MRQGLGIREQGAGAGVNSEGRTVNSGTVVVLPAVWAVGEKRPCGSVGTVAGALHADGDRQQHVSVAKVLPWTGKADTGVSPQHANGASVGMTSSNGCREGALGEMDAVAPMQNNNQKAVDPLASAKPFREEPARHVDVAFYRKYTEAMLRRYAVMSMEAGRVPSLLGREMFRGKVTNYRVTGFDDAVIFCHDVESCLNKLPVLEQKLLRRVAVQQYTHGEAALMLGLSLRSCVRHYAEAVDRLTKILLSVRLLQPQKACQ